MRKKSFSWNDFKDNTPFKSNLTFTQKQPVWDKEPKPRRPIPHISLFDTIFGRKAKKLEMAALGYQQTLDAWQERLTQSENIHNQNLQKWQIAKQAFEDNYKRKQQEFLSEQRQKNASIDALQQGVESQDSEAIIEYITLILEQSDYNDLFEKSFDIDYLPEQKTLLLEYGLPSPDEMPTVKSVRFVATTKELKETMIGEREQKANYDATCYQICLRTLHEIFNADLNNNIDKVLFNGFASYIDKSTGQDTSSCIMSIMVDAKEFNAIDLTRIDPKACFKSLKGVSAASLSALAAIPPVMELNKEDRRFIEARNTVDELNEFTNLAAMDWNDFEHLVRELFEKEFATRGGEVKITQASSDGGVDAVAFDPDPITGGKIVIQAKRYTRTVGVSAVRDLYGTMQHEGASRGILITTTDYGPDAYSFISGKPITLFTGANLLYLLDKHGYKAKIDVKEARRELNLRQI